MTEQISAAPTPSATTETDAFLARFYRQMGLYAVAAALDLSRDPVAFARQDRAASDARQPEALREAA